MLQTIALGAEKTVWRSISTIRPRFLQIEKNNEESMLKSENLSDISKNKKHYL